MTIHPTSIDATRIKKELRCDTARCASKYPLIVWDLSRGRLVTAHRAIRAAQRSRFRSWTRSGDGSLFAIYRYNEVMDIYIYQGPH